jgi:phosphoserine phosphatase
MISLQREAIVNLSDMCFSSAVSSSGSFSFQIKPLKRYFQVDELSISKLALNTQVLTEPALNPIYLADECLQMLLLSSVFPWIVKQEYV